MKKRKEKKVSIFFNILYVIASIIDNMLCKIKGHNKEKVDNFTYCTRCMEVLGSE